MGLVAAALLLAALGGGIGRSHAQYRAGPDPRDQKAVEVGEGAAMGPFVFSPSILTAVVYDDNVFGVGEGYDPDGDGTQAPLRAQGDFLMTTRARLAFKLPFSHSYVSLAWLPQYRDYARLAAPRKMSHQALLDARLNFSSGSSLRLQNDYVDSFFQARRLDTENAFRLAATPFRRNQTDLDYDWSFAGTWGFAGKLTRIDYVFDRTETVNFQDTSSGRGGTDTDTRLFDFFDYVTDQAEARGYRNFTRYQIYASATVARTQQDRSKFNQSELDNCLAQPDSDGTCAQFTGLLDSERIDQLNAGMGIKGQLSPMTTVDFRTGYATWRFARGANPPFSGFFATGNLVHTFNRRTLGYFRVQRVPVQATGQYTGYYLRTDVGVALERRFTNRLSARADLGWQKTRFPGSSQPVSKPFSLTDYIGNVEVRYRPGAAARPGPFLVTLAYAPQRTTSTLVNLPDLRSQRVTLSLQYGWF